MGGERERQSKSESESESEKEKRNERKRERQILYVVIGTIVEKSEISEASHALKQITKLFDAEQLFDAEHLLQIGAPGKNYAGQVKPYFLMYRVLVIYHLCVRVCVCDCVREREKEKESERDRGRAGGRERGRTVSRV